MCRLRTLTRYVRVRTGGLSWSTWLATRRSAGSPCSPAGDGPNTSNRASEDRIHVALDRSLRGAAEDFGEVMHLQVVERVSDVDEDDLHRLEPGTQLGWRLVIPRVGRQGGREARRVFAPCGTALREL